MCWGSTDQAHLSVDNRVQAVTNNLHFYARRCVSPTTKHDLGDTGLYVFPVGPPEDLIGVSPHIEVEEREGGVLPDENLQCGVEVTVVPLA